MKRATFFAILGIVAVAFGLGFLLTPDMALRIYGVPTQPHNLMLSRYFGSALLGFGLIFFLARDTQDAKAIRALLIGEVIGNLIGATISASAAGNLQNNMAWTSVAIYVVFAAGGAYYLFAAKPQVDMQVA